ncbi:hypothetical protein Q1695_008005 [Nippostrongylus brasiliensis]|nr:hypothetical protein Q1695_008005 [Nippostrongylus brasiliensis]
MSDEDPLVNGVPLSSLRVVDLKDELEKRGLSKLGNKSELKERLKSYLTEDEIENDDNNAGAEISSEKMGSPSNPLVAEYLAKQAKALERQKIEAERLRSEEPEEIPAADENDEVVPAKKGRGKSRTDSQSQETESDTPTGESGDQSSVRRSTRKPRRESHSQEQVEEAVSEKTEETAPSRRSSRRLEREFQQQVDEPAKQLEKVDEAPEEPPADKAEPEEEEPVELSQAGKDEEEVPVEAVAEKQAVEEPMKSESPPPTVPSPSPAKESPKVAEQIEEVNDQSSEKSPSAEPEESKQQSDMDESTQHSQESNDEKEQKEEKAKTPEPKPEPKIEKHDEKQHKDKVSAKPVEENGGGNGGDLEELDYGEAEVEAEGDAEDKDTKDEVLELDESEERAIRKQKRRLASAAESTQEHGGEKKRRVSPSRHPESEFIHIRGLTRPFTDRALKAEIMKSGGQIVNFWIDGVKSHCIVQMQSIEEAREVRLAMHNTQWPAANPKMLSVQFDTKENLERHRSGLPSSSTTAPATRTDRKLSERDRPVIGQLPGRTASLKITVEAAMRENEKREETKERERRERARTERHSESHHREEKSRDEKHESVEKDEEKHHSEGKTFPKKDERKRPRSETPPFSRGATEKRERRDSHHSRHDRDRGRDRERDFDRRRDDDRGRHRHLEEEKEKREEEKPVKTADSLFMKTKAQPAIYFLPLTEEEAQQRAAKLLAEKKKREQKEQEREKEREKEKSRR